MSTCLSDTGNKDLNGDEKAVNRDEDVMSALNEKNEDISNHEDEDVMSALNEKNEDISNHEDEDVTSALNEGNEDISNHEAVEVREEKCPPDQAKLYKGTNIFSETCFYMYLEVLRTYEPKYLIEELGGFIEFIQSHPDLQLDIISKFVFLYIHFCMMMKSRTKLAKIFFRFFENIIIEDKNTERNISEFTKEAALKFFGKSKFKMKLSKGAFLALRKELESEKRIDILRIIHLFFDFVEYEDEEEKLESKMKKQEIVLRNEIDTDLHNIFKVFVKENICSVNEREKERDKNGFEMDIGKEHFRKSFQNFKQKISSCNPPQNGVETNINYKKVFELFLQYYCLSVKAGCFGSESEKEKFRNLFTSFLKEFNSFFNINKADEETFATLFSSFLEQNSLILDERNCDEKKRIRFCASFLKGNGVPFDGTEEDFKKFHNLQNSFYERSDSSLEDFQHDNNSCTVVFSSLPSSSKAKENTEKGSSPIRQPEYSDISSASSHSPHELNLPKTNQTDQNTTEQIEKICVCEIEKQFLKKWPKLKQCHFIAIPKEDIVSASDATDLFVVCGFESFLIRVWTISDQWISQLLFDEHCTLRGHKGIVNSVEINSELQRLISGSSDGFVRIWDLKMRTCLSVHAWHSNAVYSVCWSPTSKCVLSSSADSTAVLYWFHEAIPMSVYTINEKTDVPIYIVRFHPNGIYFATAAADNSITLWTIDNNKSFLRLFDNNGIKVNTISFSPCGEFLAAGDDAGWISVWKISKGKLVKHFRACSFGIKHLSYNKSGDVIAAVFFNELWFVFHPNSAEDKIDFFNCSAGTIARSIHFTVHNKLLLIEN